MKKTPKVALLIETSNAYARELLHGIRGYLREHRPWSIYLAEHGRGDAPPSWLRGWKGDGIIARIENRQIASAVVGTRLPAVDVSAARLVPELPWMETDDTAIARLAGEHLLERGFKSFAYCGEARFNWSNWRCQAFASYLAGCGHRCAIHPRATGSRIQPVWEHELREIANWLRTLPKPVGVMACYDIKGLQILEACRKVGLAIPDDVAVIGVDNDELLCDLSDPPLTSVIPNMRRTGYEAAALLDRMMNGHRAAPEGRLFEPLGVVTRRSTDVLAIDDPHISRAVRFIREHACDGASVSDILRAVPVSRRILESRFRKLIGRSPHDQILRVKLERVKSLLVETDLPLSAIAERAGFKHVEYLSVAFKKKVGITPSAYRARNRR